MLILVRHLEFQHLLIFTTADPNNQGNENLDPEKAFTSELDSNSKKKITVLILVSLEENQMI